jgi:flagellin-like hook-associated protein FlgL
VDTSSVEVTGTFASAFALDTGTTIKIAADDTAESLRQKIAGIDGVTAEFDAEGHMIVKSEQGDDMVISGELAEKLGISGAATNGNNERAAYAKQFNDVMDQIDQLVQDTSYKGINLLNGDDLTVNFNENRTSSMELKGVTFNSSGLGFTRVADEWKSVEDIDKALDQVTKATSMLRAQASEFGQSLSTVQIREDFTTNMIKNLTTGADKLTLADTNEEAANLLALQTRQSLATTSLSLANQSAQGVLKLF